MADPRPTVGIVGLGQIGGGLATALAAGDWTVIGYDIAPAAAGRLPAIGTLAASPAAVAEAADVILVAVLDEAQVRSVVAGADGLLSAASPPAVVAILSTVGVDVITWAAAAAGARGVGVVDCGVSGGSVAATEGRLVSLLGGDDETIARVQPVIESFSSRVIHVGPLGAGMRVKLARNLVTYGSWLVAGEAGRLLQACGLDPDGLVEAIRASDPMTGGVTGLLAAPKEGRHPPAALSAIAHKDLRAALALAAELGIDLPATTLTDARFDELLGL